MEQNHSPLRVEARLSIEAFDYYVARAKAERSKAIAEFSRQFAAWVLRGTAHLLPHARRRHSAKPQTAR